MIKTTSVRTIAVVEVFATEDLVSVLQATRVSTVPPNSRARAPICHAVVREFVSPTAIACATLCFPVLTAALLLPSPPAPTIATVTASVTTASVNARKGTGAQRVVRRNPVPRRARGVVSAGKGCASALRDFMERAVRSE